MTSNLVRLAGVACLLLAACGPGERRGPPLPPPPTDAGGSSGIPGARLVTSLTPAEANTLCSYITAVQNPAPVMCDGGLTISPQTTASCVATFGTPPASCTATVGEVESCVEAIAVTPCQIFSLPQCAFLATCATASSP